LTSASFQTNMLDEINFRGRKIKKQTTNFGARSHGVPLMKSNLLKAKGHRQSVTRSRRLADSSENFVRESCSSVVLENYPKIMEEKSDVAMAR